MILAGRHIGYAGAKRSAASEFTCGEQQRQQGKSAMALRFSDGGEVALSASAARHLGYVTAGGQVMLVTTRMGEDGSLTVTTHTEAHRRSALAQAEETLRDAGFEAAIPALRALAQVPRDDFDVRVAAAALAALSRPPWDAEPLISLGINAGAPAPSWAERRAARYPLAATASLFDRIAARIVRSSALEETRG